MYCIQGGGKPNKKQQDRYECSLRYAQPIATGTILPYDRSKTNKRPSRLLLTHKDPQNARERRTTTGDSSNDSPNSPGSTKLPITKCACGRYRHTTKRGRWMRAQNQQVKGEKKNSVRQQHKTYRHILFGKKRHTCRVKIMFVPSVLCFVSRFSFQMKRIIVVYGTSRKGRWQTGLSLSLSLSYILQQLRTAT